MKLAPAPSHNLLCSVITDDYGNQFQALPDAVCRETHRQGCEFWFDGLTDPDYYAYVLGEKK